MLGFPAAALRTTVSWTLTFCPLPFQTPLLFLAPIMPAHVKAVTLCSQGSSETCIVPAEPGKSPSSASPKPPACCALRGSRARATPLMSATPFNS